MIDLVLSVLFVDTSLKSQETTAHPKQDNSGAGDLQKGLYKKTAQRRTSSNDTVNVTTLRPEVIAEQEGESHVQLDTREDHWPLVKKLSAQSYSQGSTKET